MKNSLIKSIFTITIFSVATRALGFVYKIIMSRMLTTDQLGTYNIAFSVFAVLTTILSSGIAITISRFVSINQCNNNYKKNNGLIYSGLVLTSIFCLLICLIIISSKNLLISMLSSTESYLLLICMIPALISCAIYTPFKSYLQGRELYRQSSVVEFIEQILRIVMCLIVFFIIKDLDPIYAPAIAMGIAGILSTILGIVYYKKAGGGINKSLVSIKPLLNKSTPITVVRVISSLIMPLITIILPLRLVDIGYTTEQALSELGIATGMTLPLLSIPGTIVGSLAMALIPQISALHESNNNIKLYEQSSNSIKFTIIVTSLCVPIFMALGEPICELVFNNTQAGTLIAKASWIMIPMGISQITTTILNSMGYEKSTFIYYIISAMFMTICIIFLPNIIGVEAIMWALATSNIFISIINLIKIGKIMNKQINTLPLILIIALLNIPTIYLMKYLYNILSYLLPNIINLVITAGIGLISIIALYSVFNLIEYKSIFKTIFTKTKNKKLNINEV